jgi:ubiquinone/menaquinone biosynthesis C-methylase UbiE
MIERGLRVGRVRAQHFERPEDVLVALQAHVRASVGDKPNIRVLEAGCGDTPSPLGLDRREAYIVGVDISERQLARNRWANEKVLADIETHELSAESFDIVTCWEVLEHLRAPERALERFVRSVKCGGIIVLTLPNLRSAKGLLTKLTPHWIHIWIYRRVFGWEEAGNDDLGPFRTFLRRSIAPGSLVRFAHSNGLRIDLFATCEAPAQVSLVGRMRAARWAWKIVPAVNLITAGRVDLAASELVMVLRKVRR